MNTGAGLGRRLGFPSLVTRAQRSMWGYLPALRRATRVLRSNLRCFFFAIRLRRFLMTEPIGALFDLTGRTYRLSTC